jgi:inorganic pyrophosphatase
MDSKNVAKYTKELKRIERESEEKKMEVAKANDYLQKDVVVKIDRQLGTKHPKHGFMYMLNYGFIPNTISGDGEELDAYLVGVFEPVEEFEGHVIAVIHRTNDDDDKLVVAPKDVEYSDDAIRAMTEFQERFFESVIIR